MLVCAGLALAATRSEASLSVSPALIELELDNSRPSRVLTVTNVTNQETRYRVQVVHFRFNRDGNVQTVPPDEHSMASWIKCNPREFTLGPGTTRAIRLTVLPPKSLPPGEYWAAVWFEPLKGLEAHLQDTLGAKANMRVMTNILVPVYGRVPQVNYRCELADMVALRTADTVSIATRVINTGSARVRVKGSFEILAGDGTKAGEGLIGEDMILAGGERVFRQAFVGKFPAKEYMVRVRYESKKLPNVVGGQTVLRQE